jgi:hypothetical protein
MKFREYDAEGYRKCSWCDEMIGQCMGGVMAGDMVLALRGQIHPRQIRERCGSCQLRRMAIYDGVKGPYVLAFVKLLDTFRWGSWHLQLRFRRVRYTEKTL